MERRYLRLGHAEPLAEYLVSVLTEQRWRVLFYPTPSEGYTIIFRYNINPDALSSTIAQVPGGMVHSSTDHLRESTT